MANLDISQMDAAQLKAALEALQAEADNAKKALKAAQEKERAAKKAAQEAEKALRARPAGVLVKMDEAAIGLSKERLGGKLHPYGGTDAASLGKRTMLCIQHGYTKGELLAALLAALGKDASHEDAPRHAATIDAQSGRRQNERLAKQGIQIASGRGEGQKELRYLAFVLKG